MPPPESAWPELRLDPARRTATLGSQPLEMTGRAYDLLALLASRPGHLFSAEALMAAVWPGRSGQEANLRMQIAALRKLLGRERLPNVVGRGYHLVGAVVVDADPEAEPLVGRALELQQLGQLVAQHRLVTVTGAGGIGKTTLVRAWWTARGTLRPGEPASARPWLALAGETNAARLVDRLAQALQCPLPTAPQPDQGERGWLAWTAELLALDRLHALQAHVVLDDAEPHLLRGLLQAASGVHWLVTSQLPLHVPEEQVMRLGPLEVPETSPSVRQALQASAIALFVRRVRAIDPPFKLQADNVDLVADICRRLDGLPLALELAAARVPALGLQALSRSLDSRLGLMATGAVVGPQRQRTLRDALAWSVDLLPPQTRELLLKLGGMPGAFTLQTAEHHLLGPDPDAPARWRLADGLRQLVDCSLLVKEGRDPPQYRLLELPRLYVLELLGRPPGTAARETAAPQVGEATLPALARRLHAADLRHGDQAPRELQSAVARAQGVLASGPDESPEAMVEDVLAQVVELARRGEFDRSANSLDDALAELARRHALREAAHQRACRALLRAALQQDLLRRDAAAVVRRVQALAAQQDPMHPTASTVWQAHESRFIAEGIEQVQALSLDVAEGLLRRRLEPAQGDAARADAERLLARVLLARGARADGAATLDEAAALCRAALARPCVQARARWRADLQHQLAEVLLTASRHEHQGVRLREAIEQARAALAVRAKYRGPAREAWAATQQVLGEALYRHGQSHADGLALLEGVQALRSAVQTLGPLSHPLAHAQSQIVLGNALSALARRRDAQANRQAALAAYRAALPCLDRSRHPDAWWRLHNGLGVELTLLAEDSGQDAAPCRDALAALQEALDTMPVQGMDLMRARVHHNMGLAYTLLGRRTAHLAVLEQADQHFVHAEATLTRDTQPNSWATVRFERGRLYIAMAELAAQPAAVARLEQALAWLDELLGLWSRESHPYGFVEVQVQRQQALVGLGRRRSVADWLAAIQAGEQALSVIDRQAVPVRARQLQAATDEARQAVAAAQAG